MRDGSRRPVHTAREPRPESAVGSYASSGGVRSRMQLQRTRDTEPEMAVRRLLHAQGLRYRVDRPPLPGLRRRADLVFGPSRVAVFIDGCFWHGCPEHGNPRPRSNAWYWPEKIQRNRDRDADTDRRLAAAGWLVVRAWEHDPPEHVAEVVAGAVAARRPPARTYPSDLENQANNTPTS
ncbi:very short patch repair endonuclease [Actinomycetospora atypica]|uniref:Very short patch repair endonuclease n=1 Tax=Actinomycetospora atypica TaxID=1290095 RepID=A0ABV9YHP9_9PSEU